MFKKPPVYLSCNFKNYHNNQENAMQRVSHLKMLLGTGQARQYIRGLLGTGRSETRYVDKSISPKTQLEECFVETQNPVLTVDDNGETALHKIVRENTGSSTTAKVFQLISKSSHKEVGMMSRIADSRGLLPVDYVTLSNYMLLARAAECSNFSNTVSVVFHAVQSVVPSDDNRVLSLALYRLMTEFVDIKPFNQLIDTAAVMEHYSGMRDRLQSRDVSRKIPITDYDYQCMMKHLAAACSAMNHARKVMSEMVITHPDVNDALESDVERHVKHLEALRADRERYATELHLKGQLTGVHIGWHDAYVRLAYQQADEYGIGSCGEMTFIGLYYILSQHPDVFAEIYQVGKGNHSVLVVGRDAMVTDAADPSTWGDSAIICDLTYGTVFLASEIEKKLVGYKQVTVNVNNEEGKIATKSANAVISTWNPRLIQEPCFSTACCNTLPYKSDDIVGTKRIPGSSQSEYYPLSTKASFKHT